MSESTRIHAEKNRESKKESIAGNPKSEFFQQVSPDSLEGRILHLQRTIGNQAVTRLIQSGTIQTKLTIGTPNDIYEQEADRVAQQVMRISEPMCPKCIEEEEDFVQTKLEAGQSSHQDVISMTQIHSINCPGRPLSQSTRNFFEPRFGHDFSDVRVHTCKDAVQMSKALNAQAFTYRNNIYFNKDKYNPNNSGGKRLLAHELTHVAQQVGKKNDVQRETGPNKITPVTPLNRPRISRLPIMTLFSPLCIAQAIYAYNRARQSNKSDAWKHCYVSCKIATYCGDIPSAALGILKELMDLAGMGNAEFRDLVNDARGIACSYNPFSFCDSCCE
ncbi:MAG: DUF4157 domain-containing protein [Candidatus Aminicenantes bacterium]|nr:DUF4157 domain-containing protein [Candidatus Aminicenantes bacterium]NIM83158.1 DUF4157 domain-containing protein [Candidatus Aminicenantes bacterium]NIN22534.1 DUF4157 domain-containing protein [Candidatus Aminicenantes bacterium]NIN46305.1 DUF4157 domain-containing protein [Candidatus Aminicenantes bacterium]NIN89144.1 DUF4157 domain-containing protein [Candidatus Aminicenantes bacterium]